MSLRNDSWIIDQVHKHKMISPFERELISQLPDGKKVISYGTSSYGYDVRLSNQYKIFTNALNVLVDPKNFNTDSFINYKGDFCIIPPNSFALSHSVEYVKIPKSTIAICIGKSTYARVGLILNVTPIEPEFEGHITLEISNTTPLPAKVYSNEGIGQLIFFEAGEDYICKTSYADRRGKYQGQTGITIPRV
mgnify:CR=1 FL=1